MEKRANTCITSHLSLQYFTPTNDGYILIYSLNVSINLKNFLLYKYESLLGTEGITKKGCEYRV